MMISVVFSVILEKVVAAERIRLALCLLVEVRVLPFRFLLLPDLVCVW